MLNAGIGGWTALNWPWAVWTILTDTVEATSRPTFKIAPVGVLTDHQTGPDAKVREKEPRLGNVFCANVFGHYMLAHNVMPLLHQSGTGGPNGPARIIWVSSVEATLNRLDLNDPQALRSPTPYESSKELTDVLALTADLPSTAPWVKSFTSTESTTGEDSEQSSKPQTYLSHPGICSTSIFPLPLILAYAAAAGLWLARMLGSPWHTLSTYLGAHAPVWLALAPQSDLSAAEDPYRLHDGGRAKWGSSASRLGSSSPASTEVEGWGYGGVVGRPVLEEDRARRRKRGAVDLTREEKERFEGLGRECWRYMEGLRGEWEGILDEEERRIGLQE